MAPETAGSGLCACCAHAPSCSFPRDPRRPVFFCEEYDVVRPEPRPLPRTPPADDFSAGTPAREASTGSAAHDKGLCIDCANAPSCTFPMQEGGVWHCEEYCLMESPPLATTHQDLPREVDLDGILESRLGSRGALIAVLQDIQAAYGYLPEDALRAASEKMGRPLADIYAIATFYRAFSLKPRGKHLVCACLGTACHVRGAPAVVEELERQLSVKAGGTTEDGEFTLQTVNCLGACALGPVVVIDGCCRSKMKRREVRRLIEDARSGVNAGADGNGSAIPLDVRCPRCRGTLMDDRILIDDRPSVRIRASRDRVHGSLWLSSLYGSHRFAAERDVPLDAVLRFSCPHCGAELLGAWSCPLCGDSMAEASVEGGAVLRFCTRLGCRGRMLDLV
jgi:NADH:ubiquinone oxidoreductase subunit E